MKKRKSKIGAVILAAGMSKRMGKPKLLLEINKKSLLQYVIDVVKKLSLNPVIVITGCYKDEIQNHVKEDEQIQLVYNPHYTEGMSSSLKLGINSIKNKVDAVLIFLGDQPLVSHYVVQSLIAHYEGQNKHLIVRPKYGGMIGHPVLFDASLFSEFQFISGDEGGRRIITRNNQFLKNISFNNRIWGEDVDTLKDFIRIQKHFN